MVETRRKVLVQFLRVHHLPVHQEYPPEHDNYKLDAVVKLAVSSALRLTMLNGKAIVVKMKSHDRRNQYFALLQGIMSVKKHKKKYTNWTHCIQNRRSLSLGWVYMNSYTSGYQKVLPWLH